jgi:hypothetical protein
MNRHARRAAAAREHPRTGYMRRLIAARAGGAVPRVGLFHSLIEHDSNCAIWSGGCCTCVPNVSISVPDGVVVVDPNGVCRKVRRS